MSPRNREGFVVINSLFAIKKKLNHSSSFRCESANAHRNYGNIIHENRKYYNMLYRIFNNFHSSSKIWMNYFPKNIWIYVSLIVIHYFLDFPNKSFYICFGYTKDF